ncbi:hypothetical protein ABZS66_57320 [Dactylosporangium sp. NPDC005572]|uniref:hypothetical protein n=1 Tax=Dactylosporangium sp. NPDC005572 TaxID=3156889 RepID=UPI0033B986AA
MTASEVVENSESRFAAVLGASARLPGVRINRAAYLRSALARYCSEEEIAAAIAETPAAAGIPLEVLDRAANESIRFETAKVTALSAAAGIPGFVGMIAVVPADLAQYFGHVLRIAQKLAYIYSWPDLFSDDGEDLDDATKGMLTLFLGVMFGAQSANVAVTRASSMIAKQVVRKLPQQALTKGVIYPVVKKVASYLGVQMTKQVFAKSVAKIVPVVGAVVSGGLTLATFLPMAKRLQKHLASLELTNPTLRVVIVQVIDGEVVENPDDEAGQPEQRDIDLTAPTN